MSFNTGPHRQEDMRLAGKAWDGFAVDGVAIVPIFSNTLPHGRALAVENIADLLPAHTKIQDSKHIFAAAHQHHHPHGAQPKAGHNTNARTAVHGTTSAQRNGSTGVNHRVAMMANRLMPG